jgi:adenosyl cobinamide kinase/adenosyl cobinamide phosphate guanylyltransferase
VAEGLASSLVGRALGSPVTYVATARVPEDDADLAARVAAHRARRPPAWATVEAGDDLVAALAAVPEGVVLVDSLGGWLARLPGFATDAGAVADTLRARPGPTVVVSEEVGLGVHPSTEAGRRFRDALGVLNAAVAAAAHDVLLVVAGRALRLDPVPEVLP